MLSFAADFLRAKRTLACCLATLLIHLGALLWADQHLLRLEGTPTRTVSIELNMKPPAAPAPAATALASAPGPVSPPPAAVPLPKARPARKKPRAPAAPAPTTAPEPVLAESTPPPTPTPDMAVADNPAPAVPSPALPSPSDPRDDGPPPPPMQETANGQGYKIVLPPSMELRYVLKKTSPADSDPSGSANTTTNTTTGRSTIRWTNLGHEYRLTGNSTYFLIPLFSFESNGAITENGIAPVFYTETKGTRAPTNTHFQREKQVISFSASTRQFPLTPDAQDRMSILFQLAGIGLGDSEKMGSKTAIEIVVASDREAEPWQFQVIGLEKLQLKPGEQLTWHLSRAPREGSYQNRVDVWLAPQLQWAPVRIALTEKNGTRTEMSMTDFALLSDSAPQ